MDPQTISDILKTGGQAGIVILFLLWNARGQNSRIKTLEDALTEKDEELRATVYQKDREAMEKRLTTVENRFTAVKRTLIRKGLWVPLDDDDGDRR